MKMMTTKMKHLVIARQRLCNIQFVGLEQTLGVPFVSCLARFIRMQDETSSNKPDGVRFSDLARDLNLTNAELIVKSYKLGLKILAVDLGNYRLTVEDADLIRLCIHDENTDIVIDQRPNRRATKKSKKRIREVVLRTPQEFADYYERKTEDVLKVCKQSGFNQPLADTKLTSRQIVVLTRILSAEAVVKPDGLDEPLSSPIGDLLTIAMLPPSEIVKKTKIQGSRKATRKRVSVISDEMNLSEVTPT